MTDFGPTPPGTWRARRRIIHATLCYCAVVVPALTVWRPESALVAQVVMALIGLSTTVIVTYALAATWDDKNARKAGSP